MLAVTPRQVFHGRGALNAGQQARALQMIKSGASQGQIALVFGVSKNTIAGISRRYGEHLQQREPTTLADRLAALHATLDRVLRETMVGRIAE
jgi:hypothetical protein